MTTSEAPDQTGAPERQGESSNLSELQAQLGVIVAVVLISAVSPTASRVSLWWVV